MTYKFIILKEIIMILIYQKKLQFFPDKRKFHRYKLKQDGKNLHKKKICIRQKDQERFLVNLQENIIQDGVLIV